MEAEIIGGTSDLSAGQLIDRTGLLLGLQFPAGKALAERGGSPANIARFAIATVVGVVCRVTAEAQKRYPSLPVLCSGGVASNSQLRAALTGAVFAQPQ